MISLLSRLFIKNRHDLTNPSVRSAYGVLCGVVGITLNLILFCIKLIASLLSGSVSIAADAFNNLSDAGSSLITIIGFRLAEQKPDPSHPFGHGRLEYISGFVISLLVLMMGFRLVETSIEKIVDGSESTFGITTVIILGISILVKLYMYIYNRLLGRKLDSSAMKATATDSLSDCVATSVVLLTTLISIVSEVAIDGWCGLAVALFILYSGLRTAKETMDPLLGTPPKKEFVDKIHTLVLSYPEIRGLHDLIVHNYGPGRVMISLHAEVSQHADILLSHDLIDRIERQLSEELSCHAIIHMDPIASDDPSTAAIQEKVLALAKAIDSEITLHDFRMVIGNTHTNLIFDLAVPHTVKCTEDEIKQEIARLVHILDPHYRTVVQIDRTFIS